MLRRASVQTNMEAEDEEKLAHHSRTEGISILLIFYFCYLFFPVMYRYIVQITVFFSFFYSASRSSDKMAVSIWRTLLQRVIYNFQYQSRKRRKIDSISLPGWLLYIATVLRVKLAARYYF